MQVNMYFLLFEAMVLVLFCLTLRHALTVGPLHVCGLIAGCVFGVLLELATIRQLNAYEYGKFLVMVLDVPLVIGVAWGVILYSTRLFSDATSLPILMRPVLDGLLALTIDLAMDAVAIRLGMWDWGQGLRYEYFGVPFANFWAWFWVAFSFSLGLRFFSRLRERSASRRPGAAVPTVPASWAAAVIISSGALVTGLVGVLGTNALISYAVTDQTRPIAVAAVLAGALIVTAAGKPKVIVRPHPLSFWIPFSFHAAFLAGGIVSGVIFRPMVLLAMSAAMIALSLVVHGRSVRELFVHKTA